jgi:ArsR family transcriptional regulator
MYSGHLSLINRCLLHQRFLLSCITIFTGCLSAVMRLKHFNIDLGAQIFLACSDTSRLRILNLIMTNGEMCITDLERILEFTQTKTSRHVLYLKNSGILTSRKINQWVFYQLKEEVFDITKQIFQFLRKDPILQKDQQVFETLYTNRELSLNKHKIKPISQLP